MRPIGIVAVAALLAHIAFGWWGSLASLALLGVTFALFWERRPPLPSEPKLVLSPVRGRVIEVHPDRDGWLDRDVLRIRIAVALPGIVPIRAPVEGKVMEFYTACGVFGEDQRSCRVDESPDCYVSWIRTDEDEDVVYGVSSRWPVSRARFWQSPGERVGHGKYSGFVYFASVVDVLLPPQSLPRVNAGQHVDAGAHGLAELRGR